MVFIFLQEDLHIKWASRWDYLLDSLHQSKIQWFSIMNSLVIVLFLSGMVAMIIIRSLHKDIARYNQLETAVSSFSFVQQYVWVRFIVGLWVMLHCKSVVLSSPADLAIKKWREPELSVRCFQDLAISSVITIFVVVWFSQTLSKAFTIIAV